MSGSNRKSISFPHEQKRRFLHEQIMKVPTYVSKDAKKTAAKGEG